MHVRCPHCHNPIEVVADAALANLSCPSCGSQFSLISGETTGLHEPSLKTLGHFELLEQVGSGAFGSVWKARDRQLDRIVAVKIPRQGQLSAAESEIFFREARAAAQVRHPHIVPVHELGRDQGTVYIVSDFVDGANLKQWLSAQRLTPREAAQLCIKIAEALHAAHERGIVHRDLKPGNIMLDAAGEPHLTDFGLAKRDAGEITMTVEGRILGTPAYMSPEQARGQAHTADRRADIYSLGVILFELLTGELPFRGEERMLIVQILRDDPPRPRKLASRIPRDLETICLKCLEKDPRRRYVTARDVADELARWLAGKPIKARPVSRFEHAWRWSRRNPVVAGLSGGILLILLTAVTGISLALLKVNASLSEAHVANQKAHNALTETTKQRQAAETSLIEPEKQRNQAALAAARLSVDRGIDLCERGSPDHGLNWFARAIALRPDPDDAVGRISRMNFSGWSKLIHPLDEAIPFERCVLAVEKGEKTDDVVVGSEDGTITVISARTGAKLRSCQVSSGDVNKIAISRGGRYAATVDKKEGRTCLWDGERGVLIHAFPEFAANGFTIAFSHDASLIAVGATDGTARVWDIKNSKWISPVLWHSSYVEAIAFTADRRILATGNARNITAWKIETGEKIGQGQSSYGTHEIVIDTQERKVAHVGFQGGTVFDWPSLKPLRSQVLHEYANLWTAAFDSKGSLLCTGCADRTVRLWRCVSSDTGTAQSFSLEALPKPQF